MSERDGSTRTWRLARWLGIPLFVVSGFLLLSIGGAAIMAAPLTVPLLWLVVRAHRTNPFRAVGATIAGLTVMQVGWAVVFLSSGAGRTEVTEAGESVARSSTPDVVALAVGAVLGIATVVAFLFTTAPDAADLR